MNRSPWLGFVAKIRMLLENIWGKKKQLKHLNDDLRGYNSKKNLFKIFQRMKTKTFHRVLLNFNIEKIDIERIGALFYLEIYVYYIYIYMMKTCIYFN